MKATTMLLPGVLLAGGLFLNCSSDSGVTTPTFPSAGAVGTAGAAGVVGTAGAPGASGAATAGGGMTSTTAGTGGMVSAAGGPAGTPPDATTGKCVPGALKHPDTLCYCQPTTLTYCTDGCFDPTVDADHCGSCTTKCDATQVCNAGKCSTTPVVFVPAQAGCGSMHLAVGASTLYWTETMSGKVKSVPTAAAMGTVTPISINEKTPGQIRVTGTTAYWIDNDTKNKIMKSVGGATPTAFYTSKDNYTDGNSAGAINGMAITSDGTVYFSEFKTIYKLAAAGGTAAEVGHEDSGIPHTMAVDETLHLVGYPTDINGDVDIMTMGATPAICASDDSTTAKNANCLRVGRSQGSLNFESMLLTGGTAYWGNQSQIQSASTTQLNGTNVTIASGDPGASKLPAIAFTGTSTFFVDDTGLISSAALMQNATVVEIARGQKGATSITADATNVYWAAADCSIMSTPLMK